MLRQGRIVHTISVVRAMSSRSYKQAQDAAVEDATIEAIDIYN